MGHPDKITPDIVEWIVSDDKVVMKWKDFAHRLNLNVYVPKIDENYSYKRKKFEKQKMKELFDVWQRASPITFTKSRLMDILSKENCTDMYMWLQLMNTEKNARKREITSLLDSSQSTPRSTMSLSPNPPHSYLSSGSRHSSYATPNGSAAGLLNFSSLPSSPFSWYSDDKPFSENLATHGILKRAVRPASELGSTATASSTKSDDYQDLIMNPGGHGGSADSGSRESTPDSLTRPISRVSLAESNDTPKATKTIRFADDFVDGDDERLATTTKKSTIEIQVKSPRKGTDNSVDKYFDNLISMIEEAANELK
ncbi:uncharacterized protein LOC131889861 [Tigriopus californicus]|uniref:uncharacterized protein LOC131889861 n=1 Tax=Tigriopus californicus TaxID=6832 RepID=UPI0027D9F451|nr:uncharacterized protein LOC131889861 [Tigriopus californicus]XP_059095057.1 uncharacterized protein LOC131889861 [Tigriopus californicus]XP_059095058.1 uncharacterized protein LOC131889861 [Tigriopus californicus]